jgi:hypothetical protein
MLQAEVMTVGLREESVAPKKKQARKERSALAGAALKERKPRAKKPPKADDAVHITPDLDKYKVSRDVRTESGAPSVDIGDATAKLLRGKTLDKVYKVVAKLLDASEKSLRDRYTHLNPGQQRMTLGNRLRAAVKREKNK